MTLYLSTRSAPGVAPVAFDDALLAGLAPDGGLYVPEQVPCLSGLRLSESPASSYAALAAELMSPYAGASFDHDELTALTADAYASFGHPEVCPMVRLEDDLWMLELFHGPTLAFKDLALQVVARMFDIELERRGERAMIVAATSGDTGPAAMAAIAGRTRLDIVVLHPRGATSEVQRRQMTTLEAANVHAVAIDGTFDDCQDLVKAMFNDERFRREMRLAAANSINWARVMAQIVYYVWASQRLADERPVTFCVPTGNFGNVLAGHYARRMGLGVDRLLIASNSNDILSRLIETGDLAAQTVVSTISPSMDIQVSSNFERLLHELLDGDGAATAALLARFRSEGRAALGAQPHSRLRAGFFGDRLSDAETLDAMRRVKGASGILIDPHTAVGVGVAQRHRRPDELVVALACAHPAKFPEAVAAATGDRPRPPDALAALADLRERCTDLPNDLEAVKRFVRSVASG